MKLKCRFIEGIARQCHGIPFTVMYFFVINVSYSCVVYCNLTKICYIYILKILKLLLVIQTVKVFRGYMRQVML